MATKYKTGDTWPPLTGTAQDAAGAAVNISTASSVRMVAKRVGGTEVITGATANLDDNTAPNRGRWSYTFALSDLAVAGDYEVELEVTWAAGKVETFPDDETVNPKFTVTVDLD